MKKRLLLLIGLTTLTNVSFASFPIASVVDTPITDTILNIETTAQYHLRIQEMGFDLSTCNCESCRADIPISNEIINRDVTKWYATWWMMIIWLILLVAVIIVGSIMYEIYRGLDECSGCLA